MVSGVQDGAMVRSYNARYAAQDCIHLYPVEFVVRAFLGTYPKHSLGRKQFVGMSVLDLGCGDGRNIPLLCRLGMDVHGVEISEEIVAAARRNLAHHGLQATLAVGTNARIPYADGRFNCVVACHACYYVEEGTSFRDNLREIRRVMTPDGLFVASLPMPGSHLLNSAIPLGDGHLRVANDVYGIRNGIIVRCFQDEEEIAGAFSPHFRDFRIGFTDDEFWGVRQRLWIVVCRAKV